MKCFWIRQFTVAINLDHVSDVVFRRDDQGNMSGATVYQAIPSDDNQLSYELKTEDALRLQRLLMLPEFTYTI